MLMNANFMYEKKNKWQAQHIHKKNNRIQYASKKYGNIICHYNKSNTIRSRTKRKYYKNRQYNTDHYENTIDYDHSNNATRVTKGKIENIYSYDFCKYHCDKCEDELDEILNNFQTEQTKLPKNIIPIITRKKHPVKQRKDRKKFKIQRRRKKTLKQMAFDYEDCLLRNKNENYKRIQIIPKIKYNFSASLMEHFVDEPNRQQNTYLNTTYSTNCFVCNNVFSSKPILLDEYLNGIGIDHKPKKKYRKSRRKKKKMKQDDSFEKYWKSIKDSKAEYKYLHSKRKKYNYIKKQTQKYMLAKGKISELMKLIVYIYCQQKKNNVWHDISCATSPTSSLQTKQILLNKHMNLTDKLRLNMMYFLQKQYEYHPYVYVHNRVRINVDTFTYHTLLRNNVLWPAINFMNNISVKDISDKNIDDYFKTNNIDIWKYIASIQNETKTYIPPITTTYSHSFRLEFSMTLHQGSEYQYLYHNVKHKDRNHVLTNVPMKLKNFTLEQCRINIHDNFHNIDYLNCFLSDEIEIWISIYSSAYESVYGAHEYPVIYHPLQNNKMKNFLSQCIYRLGDFPMDKLLANLKFDTCHQPYYNVLPLSFRLSRILFDYLPVRHILKHVLIPFVGYNTMHYIVMTAEVKFENDQQDIVYNTDNDCSEESSVFVDLFGSDDTDADDDDNDDDDTTDECTCTEWYLKDFYNIRLSRNGPDVIKNNRNIVLIKSYGHEFVDDLTDTEDDYSYSYTDSSSVFVDLFGNDTDENDLFGSDTDD